MIISEFGDEAFGQDETHLLITGFLDHQPCFSGTQMVVFHVCHGLSWSRENSPSGGSSSGYPTQNILEKS